MKKLTLSVLAASMAIASSVQATDKYFGVALEQANHSEPGFSLSGNVLAFKAGYFFNPNFAIEGKYGMGLSDSSTNINETTNGITITGKISGKVSNYMSILAVGFLPISDQVYGYGKIGFTNLSLSRSFSGSATDGVTTLNYSVNADDSGSGLSYAIGGEFKFSQDLSAHAEWGSLYNRENITIDGFSIGISKNF